MKTLKTIRIDLANLIAKNIATRQSVELIRSEIFRVVSQREHIEIDFANVDFISGSFADEIVRLKDEVGKKDITIRFSNTNNEVENMLKVVTSRVSKKQRSIDFETANLEKMTCRF